MTKRAAKKRLIYGLKIGGSGSSKTGLFRQNHTPLLDFISGADLIKVNATCQLLTSVVQAIPCDLMCSRRELAIRQRTDFLPQDIENSNVHLLRRLYRKWNHRFGIKRIWVVGVKPEIVVRQRFRLRYPGRETS